MNEERNLGGRPMKWEEPAEIQDAWQQYKKKCDNHTVEVVSAGQIKIIKKPRVYTLQKFQADIGCSRDCWADYRILERFSDTIKQIEAEVLGRKTEALADGEGSTPGLIFDMKVNYGWVDKQVVESKVQVTSVEVTMKQAIDHAPIATDEKDVQI